MLEDTREPEEREPITYCLLCGTPLYNGDKSTEIDNGYVCEDCKTKAAFANASKNDLNEFITSNNLEDTFTKWYFGSNEQILED